MTLRNSLLLFVLLFSISCGNNNPLDFGPVYTNAPDPFSVDGITPDTTESGLIIYTLEEGSGQLSVELRDDILLFFTGRTTDLEIFDSSYRNLETDPSRLTISNLIDGFTEGVLGMKEGGKRVLVIPPELAYLNYTGNSRTLIDLRNDTLVFDIELDTIIF